MSKTICIYHSIDLDGWMSAAIVKHWFNKIPHEVNTEDSITFIGYNYGQSIPDLSVYNKVIMCDISFPYEKMCELVEKLGLNFIWIDHHISAIKENECIMMSNKVVPVPIKMNGIRDTKFAACELTWKYLFPKETMPEIVRLLGRYDCFGHKGTDEELKVLEFQYGARQIISNYEDAYNELRMFITNTQREEYILNIGETVYTYLCQEAKQVYKTGFEIILKEPKHIDETYVSLSEQLERRFICINKERFNPINFGIDYHKEGYDGAACFHYANGMWNFSLYNDNGAVDCSVIAKQFGGGGHKGASGFRIKSIDTIITN